MNVPLEFLFLPLAALICYWPSINGPFLFDDRDAILHNEIVTGGKWRSALRSPWRGLTLSTYAVQCLWPKTSRSFHIVNILIHAMNGGIFRFILLALGFDTVTADRGAILYICLPFAANTVPYIAGRAAMLSGTFGLLGVLGLLWEYPALAAIALLWAIYAKEDGAGYALTFAAVHAWTGSPWFWLWLAVPPIVTILPRWSFLPPFMHALHWRAILSLARNKGSSTMLRGGLPGNLPQPEHAWTVWVESLLMVPAWALGLCQSPYHGSGISVPSIRRSFASGLIIGCWILPFYLFPEFRLPLILLTIGPWMVYLVVPAPDQLIEYRYYSCLAGVALAFTTMLASAPSWAWAGVIAYAASNTAWQAHAWHSGVKFWTASIYRGCGEKSRSWQELGAEYKNARNLVQAEVCFRRSLEMNPRLAPAMRNLSWIWVEQGKLPQALDQMRECVARCPEHPSAWEEYGYMLELSHMPGEAEEAYRRALTLTDEFLDLATLHLGMLLFARQDYNGAVEYFSRRAVSIEERWNLGWALRLAGRKEEAKKVMEGFPPEVQMTTNMVMPPQMKQEVRA